VQEWNSDQSSDTFAVSCSHNTYNLAYSADNAVNDHLSQTPELCLLALTQLAISTDTEVVSAKPFRSITNLTNVTTPDAFIISCSTPQASCFGQPHLKHNYLCTIRNTCPYNLTSVSTRYRTNHTRHSPEINQYHRRPRK